MRKMIVNITVRLKIDAEDDVELSEIIDDLDYDFSSGGIYVDGNFAEYDILDTEITNYELIDSK